jgi:hypothetical protein
LLNLQDARARLVECDKCDAITLVQVMSGLNSLAVI